MSGLLSRSHMTTAKMGSATRAPNMMAMLKSTNGLHGLSRVLGSIDHTICSLSSKLRPQREARFALAQNVKLIITSYTLLCLIMLDHPFVLTDGRRGAPRAGAVKTARRIPPYVARSGLDGASAALNWLAGKTTG